MAGTELFVLDASALAKIFLDQAQADEFTAWYGKGRMAGAHFLAPALLRYEIGQILAREHRGTADNRREFLARALAGVDFEDRWTESAFDHTPGLSFYDAAYLALAKREKAVLVTYDQKLLQAAAHAKVRTLSPGAK